MENCTFPHYALIQMYVSLYKLSIERYYIEGLYEVTYNCITSGLSRSTTCTRTPGHRPPPDQTAPATTTTGTHQPVSRSENRRTSTRKLGGLS